MLLPGSVTNIACLQTLVFLQHKMLKDNLHRAISI